jgi:hypothetical protein
LDWIGDIVTDYLRDNLNIIQMMINHTLCHLKLPLLLSLVCRRTGTLYPLSYA